MKFEVQPETERSLLIERVDSRPAIAVFGASGKIGSALLEGVEAYVFGTTYHHDAGAGYEPRIEVVDVTDLHAVMENIARFKAQGVTCIINCTGITTVDLSETERGDENGQMYRVNVIGARNLALASKLNGLRLIHLSTRYVFDGTKTSPYREDDSVNISEDAPTWYGITKALAEQQVQAVFTEDATQYTIIRLPQIQTKTSGLFHEILQSLQQGVRARFMTDQLVAPITIQTAMRVIYGIEAETRLKKGLGIIHVNALDAETPYVIANMFADLSGMGEKKNLFVPITRGQLQQTGSKKNRPANTVLDTQYFVETVGEGILKSLQREIEIFIAALGEQFP